jgi:hypothetical protein
MKYLYILLFTLVASAAFGQSLLQLLQKKQHPVFAPSDINLIDLTPNPPFPNLFEVPRSNAPSTIPPAYKHNEDLSDDQKSTLSRLTQTERKIIEIILRDNKVADSTMQIYRHHYLEHLILNYNTRLNELETFLSINKTKTRESEINYYLLEEKVKDLKLSQSANIMSNQVFRDSLENILRDLYMTWFDIELIKSTYSKLEEEKQNVSNKNLSTLPPDSADITSIFRNADLLRNRLDTGLKQMNETFRALKDRITKTNPGLPKSSNAISTSPALNNFANKFSPSLTLLGSAKFGKNYNELGLFTGGLFNGGNPSKEAIFFHDLSDFSIYYKGASSAIALVDTNQKTGLNYEIYFMSKQLGADTTLGISPISYHSIQLKAGFEYVVYKNIASIYSNINYHLPLSQRSVLEKVYGSDRLDQINFDVGVKMLLNPSQTGNGGTNLFVDVNLMFLTNSMKTALKSKDSLLPGLRIGVQQRLTKFE